MNIDQIVEKMQHKTMQVQAKDALQYHFEGIKTNFKFEEGTGRVFNMSGVIFEAIAYLNWLKRIWHYYNNVKKSAPHLMDKDFEDTLEPLVKWFANKWASHRAVDFPKSSDSDYLKAFSTQLDVALIYDMVNGPIFHTVDDKDNALSWIPFKEHDRLMALVDKFLKAVAALKHI